jgi:NAD(P)H-dependent flavin oxidoreductase YrpB (nitropropane dioxygenase family)
MRTRITELLGIQYPIIQAPTSPIAAPTLVAAVSNAGGLGILATARLVPEELRNDIKAVREKTDKPFGVNLVAGIPGYETLAKVMIEEKVPLICHGRGNPKWLIGAVKGHGIVIMALVGSIRHAVRAEEDGADIIAAAGAEAGGHVGDVSTVVLLPLIASKVKIPVAAAGGFCDGRGLVAALALGAEGILMGTRFAVSQESAMPSNIKQRYIESGEADTMVTSAITGARLRVLRNKLTDLLEANGQKLSWREKISSSLEIRRMLGVSWWRFLIGGWRMKKAYESSFSGMANLAAGKARVDRALVEGDADWGAMPSGQVCARIDDIPTAKEIIERTVAEASIILESLKEKGVPPKYGA